MGYIECLQALLKYRRRRFQDLSQVSYVNQLLGNPSLSFKSIHIAGTNGKGSVATKLAKAYELQGCKTGLFTSPHISCFRERIRINGEMIEEKEFVQLAEGLLRTLDEKGMQLGFFDLATLLAFQHFSNKHVDFAIVEAGVGGRLDATNIVMPQLSIITSISIDHSEVLGDSIDEIALEKAGIIKPGVPVLIGPRVPKSIIDPVADKHSCVCRQVSGDFPNYLDENIAIAKAAMDMLDIPNEVQAVSLQAWPPCRMEALRYKGVPVVMDVAHNPEGIKRLFEALKLKHPAHGFRVVVGLSKSKDVAGCLSILKNQGIHFYPVEARGLGESASQLSHALSPVSLLSDVTSAIQTAIADADPEKDIVVVCGTCYIMSEARQALGILESIDPPFMN